jgi:uncharacterized protein
LRRWGIVALLGGLAGVSFVDDPRWAFVQVVLFLLVLASVAMLIQPLVTRIRRMDDRRTLLPCGLFVISLYDGYFGAGYGVVVAESVVRSRFWKLGNKALRAFSGLRQ